LIWIIWTGALGPDGWNPAPTGNFETLEPDGTLLTHTFERGDALILLAHKWHSVSALTAGRRNILVSEIWEGLPRRCPQRCDQPWLPCTCRMEALYTSRNPNPAIICELCEQTDAERLLENGRAYWREATEREAAEGPPAEEREESLLDWARRVKEQVGGREGE
jgi:hypothetical protein